MATARNWTTILAVLVLCFGCMSASEHAADVQKGMSGDKLTVGTVQREIHHGMSGAEVAGVLGSPNIMTRDEQGREVWIYDRVSTDTVYSSSEGGISSLILGGVGGGSGLIGGLGGAGGQQSAGAKSTSQRTLTIIIKFDDTGKVSSFAYHATQF